MRNALIGIVDDDDALRVATTSLLRSCGFACEDFSSAEAFLDAEDGRFDAVLTDIQMPGASGVELAETLRIRAPALPVVVMTARNEKHLEESARKAGAFCFLTKPFDAERLLACLTAALAMRAGQSG